MNFLIPMQRRWIEKVISFRTRTPPPPKNLYGELTHYLVINPYFEWVILVVVLVDITLIIVQLTVFNSTAVFILRYINCVIVGVYTSEAILKVGGVK